MMKSKNLMVVFILMVAFLLLMATCTKASDVTNLELVINTNQGSTQNQVGENDTTGNNPIDLENKDVGNNTTLPQTGVASDTTLFIFIGVCIASAVYAYIKIKNYNNVH